MVLAILPFVKPIVMSFGPPEFFWLVMMGMVTVAFAAKGNLIKGLIGGGIGVMISMVGYDQMTGAFRYTFGSDYLWDGLSLVTFVTGLFAISELIAYATQGGSTTSSAGTLDALDWRRQAVRGVRDVLIRPTQVLRSTAIGAAIGVIPGLGGAVASFMSYAAGSHQTKDPDYGQGSPEGIIASETANDAKDGGALLPTVAFGIPGSPDMAILLGAFILHGLRPGPAMLDTHLNIVLLLLFGIVLAQIITSFVGLAAAPYLARLSLVSSRWIAPFVLLLVVAGTFMLNGNILDSGVAVIVGIFGFVLRKAGFPLVTIAIGFILGPLIERSLSQSMLISGGDLRIFVDNPIALGLMLATFVLILVPSANVLRRSLQQRGRRKRAMKP
jgi:putative tricarboxylic transport membrane protein